MREENPPTKNRKTTKTKASTIMQVNVTDPNSDRRFENAGYVLGSSHALGPPASL